MKKILLALSLISTTAFAVENCSYVNSASPTGTICVTSKGFEFSRVDGGWKDISSGTTWYDETRVAINQYDSQKYCAGENKALPSGYPENKNGVDGFPNKDSDYVTAEKHGFQEVFKVVSIQLYWSSSIHPDDPNFVYGFIYNYDELTVRNYGVIYHYSRNEHDSYNYARCVSYQTSILKP